MNEENTAEEKQVVREKVRAGRDENNGPIPFDLIHLGPSWGKIIEGRKGGNPTSPSCKITIRSEETNFLENLGRGGQDET